MPKTPEEIKLEHIEDLKRQLKYLLEEVKDWKEKFPTRWEDDVTRVKTELAGLVGEEVVQTAEEKTVEKVEVFKCETCGKEYSREGSYNNHLKIHI